MEKAVTYLSKSDVTGEGPGRGPREMSLWGAQSTTSDQ